MLQAIAVEMPEQQERAAGANDGKPKPNQLPSHAALPQRRKDVDPLRILVAAAE
jgi:hypothetical protein